MLRSILVGLVWTTACLSTPSLAQTIKGVDQIVYGTTYTDVFRRPMGLAIDAERGILAIADTGNHRLALFDAMGRSRGALSWEDEDGLVASGEPRCVAIDRRGRLFVLDTTTGTIEVLSSAGSRLGYLNPQVPEAAMGRARPQFIAVAASGRCYVLFSGEVPGIAVVEPNGRTSSTLGFNPAGRGIFQSPVALAVDSAETRLVVLDPQADHQVKVCTADGRLLHRFGPHGEGEGTFALALFAAWGPGDTLWIVDTVRHSISVFDADGTYRTRLCGFGREPGQLNYPSACGFLAANRFVVLERAGARFQILELEPPVSWIANRENGLELSGPGGSGSEELD